MNRAKILQCTFQGNKQSLSSKEVALMIGSDLELGYVCIVATVRTSASTSRLTATPAKIYHSWNVMERSYCQQLQSKFSPHTFATVCVHLELAEKSWITIKAKLI